MNKVRGLSIFVMILLILQMFSVNVGVGSISQAANDSNGAELKVSHIDTDDQTLTWEVAINVAGEEETAKTNISLSDGQSHQSIEHPDEIIPTQTEKGYEIETPADGLTYSIKVMTEITEENVERFELVAETELDGNQTTDQADFVVERETTEEVTTTDAEYEEENKVEESKTEEENEPTSADVAQTNKKEGVESEHSAEEIINHHTKGQLPNITPKALHTLDEGKVEVDKIATPTSKFLEWEVQLDVSGEDIKQETYDIVLVFDRSNSMDAGNREASSKAAAKSFAHNLLAGPSDNIRIGVVPFGSHTSGNSTTGRIELTKDAQAVEDAIESIIIGPRYDDGGTHISAGLEGGKDMLSDSPADHQIIVLFSDGEPTYSYKAGDYVKPYDGWTDGSSTYDYILKDFGETIGNGRTDLIGRPNYNLGPHNCGPLGLICSYHVKVRDHIIPTISHAHQEIMGAGIGVYSIGFEVSGKSHENARYTLSNSQNLGYYNADSDDIEEIFDEISSAIKHAASGSYVIDEIGEMFEIVEGSILTSHDKTATYDPNSRQINWNIGSIIEADGTYTLTYKVRLDCEQEPLLGEKYPTNAFATLHYKNPDGIDTTKDFPIPAVEAEVGQITKVGFRVNAKGNPIDAEGNEVSTAEAVQLYEGLYGENLVADTYAVSAGDTPEGYVLHENYPNPTEVELSSAVCHVVPFGYIKTGQFTIEKIDRDNPEKKLAGATFEVYDNEQEKVDTLTTGKDGTVTSSVLPEGTYTLKEIEAPKGYALNEETDLQVTIDGDAKKPVTIVVQNELANGKVKVIKVDAEDEAITLPGAEFNILDGDEVVGHLITNEHGEAISEELIEGDYSLEEVNAPTGYALSDQALNIRIVAGETIEVVMTNEKLLGTVTIHKVDESGDALAGAQFTLTGPDGNEETAISDAEGRIVFDDLTWGQYTLKETKAPEGYRLLAKEKTIDLSADHLVIEKTIENSPIGWEVPNTGGIGSLSFFGAGLLLMTSTIWYVLRRRQVS